VQNDGNMVIYDVNGRRAMGDRHELVLKLTRRGRSAAPGLCTESSAYSPFPLRHRLVHGIVISVGRSYRRLT
jgi:hypothetical protein